MDNRKGTKAVERRRRQPLRVRTGDGLLSISIGIDTLAKATELNPENSRPDGKSAARVTDADAFAAAVVEELGDEEEDGTTPVHQMLDAAAGRAIENGAEGVEWDEGEW